MLPGTTARGSSAGGASSPFAVSLRTSRLRARVRSRALPGHSELCRERLHEEIDEDAHLRREATVRRSHGADRQERRCESPRPRSRLRGEDEAAMAFEVARLRRLTTLRQVRRRRDDDDRAHRNLSRFSSRRARRPSMEARSSSTAARRPRSDGRHRTASAGASLDDARGDDRVPVMSSSARRSGAGRVGVTPRSHRRW